MPPPEPSAADLPQPLILLISDDLMAPARIREALRPAGYRLLVVGTLAAAQSAIATAPAPPVALLVNLTARRYDPVEAIAALKQDPASAAIPLLAFAGHLEKDKHEAARRAGADRVAANSSVALHLPALLSRLLSGEPLPDDTEADEDAV